MHYGNFFECILKWEPDSDAELVRIRIRKKIFSKLQTVQDRRNTTKPLLFRVTYSTWSPRVSPRHPDAQRRLCFAAFYLSSYVFYPITWMRKVDVILPRSKCHPTCLISSSGCAKKTMFDAQRMLFCCVPNVILRVLPRHPDEKRRHPFAAFQMSSYVSFLVNGVHKEDAVLPRSKCHPTCLTSSSGCTKKTMLCRGAFRLISSDGIVTLESKVFHAHETY